jgi:hypothetical protein
MRLANSEKVVPVLVPHRLDAADAMAVETDKNRNLSESSRARASYFGSRFGGHCIGNPKGSGPAARYKHRHDRLRTSRKTTHSTPKQTQPLYKVRTQSRKSGSSS